MVREEEIRELAYAIWEKEGRPIGREVEHYFRAKQILEKQATERIIELAPPPPVFKLTSISPSTKENMQAYCLKCRTKRYAKNPQSIQMRNGRAAIKGTCPVCGTRMFRIYKV
ncbi:MAG: DUF2934 domain-containing protein [Dehalococcoidia bacterium]|jgi:hypothetical protein|nr:MAG: DUF2934 domain-containing protein [Dehalococcoidia bacterium]